MPESILSKLRGRKATPQRDYGREAWEREQETLFRMDKDSIQRDFLSDTPRGNMPLSWRPLSLKGMELAEQTLQPTGVMVREVKSKDFTERYETCNGSPYTVRYQKFNEAGQVVRMEYFKYSPESYPAKYSVKQG